MNLALNELTSQTSSFLTGSKEHVPTEIKTNVQAVFIKGIKKKINVLCFVRGQRALASWEMQGQLVRVKQSKKDLFWSIRSHHSQNCLEMVWKDSFPGALPTFLEKVRRYNFCPIYFVLP